MAKSRFYYTIYRGDDIVANGTMEECAKQLGVSRRYLYVAYHNTKNGKSKYYDFEREKL